MNRFIEVLKDGVDANYEWYNSPSYDVYNEDLENLGFEGISPFYYKSIKDVCYGVYCGMQVIAMFDGYNIEIFIMPIQRLGYFLNYIYRFCESMPMADQLWGYVDSINNEEEWKELKEYIDEHYGIL